MIDSSYIILGWDKQNFSETHFKIKTSETILRRFDLSEIIFKFNKKRIELCI